MNKSYLLLSLLSVIALFGCSQQPLPDTPDTKPNPNVPTKSVMMHIDKATGKPIN